jgi:hypothetical protein
MGSSKARGWECRQSARSGASAKWSRLMACSGAGGGDVLWAKRSRSRVKRSSGVEGEAVEVTACSGCWRRQRPKAHEWWKFAKCGAGRTHT